MVLVSRCVCVCVHKTHETHGALRASYRIAVKICTRRRTGRASLDIRQYSTRTNKFLRHFTQYRVPESNFTRCFHRDQSTRSKSMCLYVCTCRLYTNRRSATKFDFFRVSGSACGKIRLCDDALIIAACVGSVDGCKRALTIAIS